MQAGASSSTAVAGLLQMLAAPAARGGDTALGREGRVVEGRTPGGAEVLLGQPDVTQRQAAGAAHGRREGDGALQRAVLLAGEDCRRQRGPYRRKQTQDYNQLNPEGLCLSRDDEETR